MADTKRILLIYTGGTIGMVRDLQDGRLLPFDFETLLSHIPEIHQLAVELDTVELSEIIDSSDMRPALWVELAQIIAKRYEAYDGFVILHGTDTLAYTASALSYMIQGLGKPIILTGSQLPIGTIRTDGKENLITAIEIAAAEKFGQAIVPEVAVYFEYRLMRGNRVTKYSAEHFDAFHSPNYPHLAEAGTDIEYDFPYLRHASPRGPMFSTAISEDVAVIKLFPGISHSLVRTIAECKVRGIILESFGAGNAPTDEGFLSIIAQAVTAGKTVLNITQCLAGGVQQGRYASSKKLADIGVVSGGDMSFEAGITKLMWALAQSEDRTEISRLLEEPLVGERDQ